MDFENKRVKWFYWGVGVKILWISAFLDSLSGAFIEKRIFHIQKDFIETAFIGR